MDAQIIEQLTKHIDQRFDDLKETIRDNKTENKQEHESLFAGLSRRVKFSTMLWVFGVVFLIGSAAFTIIAAFLVPVIT